MVLSSLVEEVAYGEGVKSNCKKIGKKLKRRQEIINKDNKDQKCEVKLDVRMQTKTNAEEVFSEIANTVTEIAHETGNNYYCQKTDKAEPVKTSGKMVTQIQNVCEKKGIKSTVMPSWAGHDVAHMSILEKMLLFIQSTGGSHNPQENTTKEDIEKGIIVLEGTVEEDINQVHKVAQQVEYLDNQSVLKVIENQNANTRKGAIRKVLFSTAEAKNLGIKVPEKVQKEIRQEIVANRNNLEK